MCQVTTLAQDVKDPSQYGLIAKKSFHRSACNKMYALYLFLVLNQISKDGDNIMAMTADVDCDTAAYLGHFVYSS
jgi:hypothetical protein